MPRRRSEENGLKRQQRIQRELRERELPPPELTETAPVPPGATQLIENTAPPLSAPRPEE